MNEYTDFFNDIEKACIKYDCSISHEDGHGAFIIMPFDEYYMELLKKADRREYVNLEMDNEVIDKFLNEIEDICRKHDSSISHEDAGHGAFIIEFFDEFNIEWLKQAE